MCHAQTMPHVIVDYATCRPQIVTHVNPSLRHVSTTYRVMCLLVTMVHIVH